MTHLTGDELPNEHLEVTKKISKLCDSAETTHTNENTQLFSDPNPPVKLSFFLEKYVNKLILVSLKYKNVDSQINFIYSKSSSKFYLMKEIFS